MTGEMPHVVILGGGFAGLFAARRLSRAPVRITLIDRRNHHLFQPLLYQVATAALNPSDIAEPIRRILRHQSNASVILGDATAIDVSGKKVLLRDCEIGYDYLIVAAGVTHSYFGHDDWPHYAPGLKTIDDALEIRKRVLMAYEEAERENDIGKRREWMSFVVIGAGPTGVELAGALAEIARHSLAHDFRHIDPAEAKILLLEGKPGILPSYPPDLADRAKQNLERLGVEVRTGAAVTSMDERGIDMGRERIPARTKLWAAGIQGAPIAKTLGAPVDGAGRVMVTPELAIPGRSDIFVVGDLAHFEQDGALIPGVAPAAIQQGIHAADNILREVKGQQPRPFRYVDKGSLATIGRSAAVADLGPVRLSGFVAWVAWLVVHIYFLIGFRNRLLVIIEWAWVYLTWDRGARLITGETPPYSCSESESGNK